MKRSKIQGSVVSLVSAIEIVATCLIESASTLVFTGAGLSVESGVPSFRGSEGLWTRYGTPSPDSYRYFLEDPAMYWRNQIENVRTEGYMAELRKAIDLAVPNAGHDALATLERHGLIDAVITQNIDGLHHKAGSQKIVELHGSRYKVRCVECHLRIARDEFDITTIPPRCLSCNGLIKGDSVMFGEPIPRPWVQWCLEYVSKCECIVLVGTSGTVYPAASFPRMVQSNGGILVEINPQETEFSESCDIVIRGSATRVLPSIVNRFLELMI